MNTDTVILATAWIHQAALSARPERTLLVGAATLGVRYRFGTLGFDIEAHSTTVADDPAETMTWLAERLHVPPGRRQRPHVAARTQRRRDRQWPARPARP